jgi:hypothetical protein
MTRRTTAHHAAAIGRAVAIHRAAAIGRRTLTVAMAAGCLAACSHPDTPRAGHDAGVPTISGLPGAPAAAPSSDALPPPPPPPPDSVSASPTFAEASAVSCAGQPSADQVTARVRAAGLIDGGAKATVTLGPMCAGSWQYTVLNVAGREPLQVVTDGQPAALTLVTAGTDVCSTEVLTQAPPGIIDATHCGLGMPPG